MSTRNNRPALRPPDQQTLFNIGMDLSKLRKQKERFVALAKAPNTLKAYAFSWRVFADWCAMTGRSTLPADEETITLFLTWSADERRYRRETMSLALSAIQDRHVSEGFPSPLTPGVREVMAGIVRDLKEVRNGAEAVRVEHLRKICRRLKNGNAVQVRDKAIILVGFASAWRRSELAGLQLKDVKIEKEGARLWLPQSKGDQEGKGEETEIVYAKSELLCPVRALEAWLKIRGRRPGPLFCGVIVRVDQVELTYEALTGQRINLILKTEMKRAGIDPTNFSAHSMRAGMITEAARKNVPLTAIMHHSRHRQIETVVRYVRRDLPFRQNPLARVL